MLFKSKKKKKVGFHGKKKAARMPTKNTTPEFKKRKKFEGHGDRTGATIAFLRQRKSTSRMRVPTRREPQVKVGGKPPWT